MLRPPAAVLCLTLLFLCAESPAGEGEGGTAGDEKRSSASVFVAPQRMLVHGRLQQQASVLLRQKRYAAAECRVPHRIRLASL